MKTVTELFDVICTPIYFNYRCVKEKNTTFAICLMYCNN